MTTVPMYRVWNVKHILLIPSYGMVPPCLLLPFIARENLSHLQTGATTDGSCRIPGFRDSQQLDGFVATT